MNLSVLINKFLSPYSNTRTYQEYKRKIMVFIEFLKKDMHMDESNYEMILGELSRDVFCRSVEFYINHYHLKFQSPVLRYLTVVSMFFKYIDKNYGINNDIFINSNKYENLKISFEDTIQNLKIGEGKEPLTPEDFEMLREYCEDILSNFNPDTDFLEYRSAIILKITMLFGLKSNEIDKLKVGCHDSINHKITINGYTLRLPDGLAKQLIDYKKIRMTIQPYSDTELLFVAKTGNALTSNKSKYWAMEKPLEHKKSESVAKRAIINLLLSGITTDMIVNLTGFSENVCQECIDISKEGLDIGSDNRYFDSHLRSIEIFDML